VLNRLTRVVHEGGAAARARRPPPLAVAEGVVGGGLSVIHSGLLRRGPVSLIDLLSPLTAFVVLPYLGGAAVQRELLRAIRQEPERVHTKAERNRTSRGTRLSVSLSIFGECLSDLHFPNAD
jgi:hypothetical protein